MARYISSLILIPVLLRYRRQTQTPHLSARISHVKRAASFVRFHALVNSVARAIAISVRARFLKLMRDWSAGASESGDWRFRSLAEHRFSGRAFSAIADHVSE
jgi:hypothetical protein